jgi:hypothetical protein
VGEETARDFSLSPNHGREKFIFLASRKAMD